MKNDFAAVVADGDDSRVCKSSRDLSSRDPDSRLEFPLLKEILNGTPDKNDESRFKRQSRNEIFSL